MRAIIALAALGLLATDAAATTTCTQEPAEKWMPLEEFRGKVLAPLGHRIDVLKITAGNCYELYGRTRAGARVEIYFDPVTGQVIKATAIQH